jgi:hypothetical protein
MFLIFTLMMFLLVGRLHHVVFVVLVHQLARLYQVHPHLRRHVSIVFFETFLAGHFEKATHFPSFFSSGAYAALLYTLHDA